MSPTGPTGAAAAGGGCAAGGAVQPFSGVERVWG